MNSERKAVSFVVWGGLFHCFGRVFGWLVGFFPREDDIIESLQIAKSLMIRNAKLCIAIQFRLQADLKQTSDSNGPIFFTV